MAIINSWPDYLLFAWVTFVPLGLVVWVARRHSNKHARWGLATLVFLAWGALPLWIWYTFFGPGYLAEYHAIKAKFAAMPGVEVIDAGGYEDIVVEDIWVRVQVEGKGPLEFGALSLASFGGQAGFCLNSIGGHQVVIVDERSSGAYRSDTGVLSDVVGYSSQLWFRPGALPSQFVPLEIVRVQDAIEHYDDLLAALEAWPMQPSYTQIGSASGDVHYVSRLNPSLDDPLFEPWPRDRIEE